MLPTLSRSDTTAAMPSHNPLRALPLEALKYIREYASDRVRPHPSALLIKECEFTRSRVGDLCVKHEALTHLTDSCMNPMCWLCKQPSCCCSNARTVTLHTGYRQFINTDFEEPDRYMELHRPKTVVDPDGNVVNRLGNECPYSAMALYAGYSSTHPYWVRDTTSA
jgi:hypothetical protein